jgi:glycosyltransferase involved in cell wall biosynthesis
MMGVPVILTIADAFRPGEQATGPVQSLSLLVRALGREFEFRIVGTRPASSAVALSANGVGTCSAETGAIRYQRSSRVAIGATVRLLKSTRYDLLYINGFFDGLASLSILAHRILRRRAPIILAPRGELSPGAIRIKRGRKTAFLFASRLFGLHRGVMFQATSELERREIQARFPSASVLVAANLAHDVSPLIPVLRETGPLKLIYLSRVDTKKNLHLALEALSQLAIPVVFDIYGPVTSAAYWARCQELMRSLPVNVIAAYRGAVGHAEVAETLRGYDLFFLPTAGENFGHAIYESLAAGVPVLISDRTPWRGLEGAEAGFDLPLERPEAFARCIERFAAFPKDKREKFSRGARNMARRMVNNAGAIEAHRSMFRQAIGAGPKVAMRKFP